MAKPRRVREILTALGPDWSFEGDTRAGHLCFRHRPTGARAITGGTPGDTAALRNFKSDARRAVREAQERKRA